MRVGPYVLRAAANAWRIKPARGSSRGQGLAEFVLIIPVLLLVTLVAIDFGRVFLGWINLQNMARIAANEAASHANAWTSSERTAYQQLVLGDAAAINCDLQPDAVTGAPVPEPSFPVSLAIGQPVRVTLGCRFHVMTPVIGAILGNTVNVGASAVFPIKGAMTETTTTGSFCSFSGSPVTDDKLPLTVTFTDNSTKPIESRIWSFGDGTDSVTVAGDSTTARSTTHTYTDPTRTSWTVSLSVQAADGTHCFMEIKNYISLAMCTVPDFTGRPGSDAPLLSWGGTYTGTITYQPKKGDPFTSPAPSWTVESQSVTAQQPAPCGTSITLFEKKSGGK